MFWCILKSLRRESDHYLLFRDTTGQTAWLEPGTAPFKQFGSQYFRRVLMQHFCLDVPWDWRHYDGKEPWSVDTLQFFSAQTVDSVCAQP